LEVGRGEGREGERERICICLLLILPKPYVPTLNPDSLPEDIFLEDL
jgi:hypothetical protein